MRDAFLNAYLSALQTELAKLTESLMRTKFEALQDVTRIQGRIDGLNTAITILSQVYDEQDS